MSTMDNLITQDLAAVGRASRARPLDLAHTLRTIGATREPTQQSSAASSLIWELGHVFVARSARVAGGIASLACIGALTTHLAIVRGPGGWDDRSIIDTTLMGSKLVVAIVLIAIILAVQLVAWRISAAWFARGLATGGVTAVRERVQRLGRCTLAVSIAGVATFVVWNLIMLSVLGPHPLEHLREPLHDGRVEAVRHFSFGLLAVTAVVAIAGAILVARWRHERPRTGLMIATGLGLLVIAVIAWLHIDVGPLYVTHSAHLMPSFPMRILLTGAATVASFLVVAGVVLGIHRREDARIASADQA